MKDKSKFFKQLNLSFFLILVIIIVFIIIGDLYAFYDENPGELPNIWYWDNDLILMNSEGIAKIICTIFNTFALICFIIVTIFLYLNKKRKEKSNENSYISTVVFYSSLFIVLARLFELYYIPSQSDLNSLLNGIGQFFLPFDTYALTLFLVFAIEVFLVDENEKINWSRLSLIFGIASLVIGSLTVLIDNENILIILIILAFLVIIIELILVIIVFIKIITIRSLTDDEDTKSLLTHIGILFFLFFLGFVFFLTLYLTKGATGDILHYQLRTFKNLFYIFIAYYYYKAIIQPSRKSSTIR